MSVVFKQLLHLVFRRWTQHYLHYPCDCTMSCNRIGRLISFIIVLHLVKVVQGRKENALLPYWKKRLKTQSIVYDPVNKQFLQSSIYVMNWFSTFMIIEIWKGHYLSIALLLKIYVWVFYHFGRHLGRFSEWCICYNTFTVYMDTRNSTSM